MEKCLLLTNSESCSAFQNFSVPITLFPSVSHFDSYVRQQVQQTFQDAAQNCTNTGSLGYIDGLTTQVCQRLLTIYWRSYLCGRGAQFGVGSQPPHLCWPTCAQWVERYNSLVPHCKPTEGTRGLIPLQLERECADAVQTDAKIGKKVAQQAGRQECIVSDGGVSLQPAGKWVSVGWVATLVYWMVMF